MYMQCISATVAVAVAASLHTSSEKLIFCLATILLLRRCTFMQIKSICTHLDIYYVQCEHIHTNYACVLSWCHNENSNNKTCAYAAKIRKRIFILFVEVEGETERAKKCPNGPNQMYEKNEAGIHNVAVANKPKPCSPFSINVRIYK